MHWHAGYDPPSTLNASACRVKVRGSCSREYQGLYLQLLWRSHGWAINLARTSKQGMAREQFCMLWSAGCGSGITLRAVKFRVWLTDNPVCRGIQGWTRGRPCIQEDAGSKSGRARPETHEPFTCSFSARFAKERITLHAVGRRLGPANRPCIPRHAGSKR